jgi:hypothetical protein
VGGVGGVGRVGGVGGRQEASMKRVVDRSLDLKHASTGGVITKPQS